MYSRSIWTIQLREREKEEEVLSLTWSTRGDWPFHVRYWHFPKKAFWSVKRRRNKETRGVWLFDWLGWWWSERKQGQKRENERWTTPSTIREQQWRRRRRRRRKHAHYEEREREKIILDVKYVICTEREKGESHHIYMYRLNYMQRYTHTFTQTQITICIRPSKRRTRFSIVRSLFVMRTDVSRSREKSLQRTEETRIPLAFLFQSLQGRRLSRWRHEEEWDFTLMFEKNALNLSFDVGERLFVTLTNRWANLSNLFIITQMTNQKIRHRAISTNHCGTSIRRQINRWTSTS